MLVSEKLKLTCVGDDSLKDKSIRNFMLSIGFQNTTSGNDKNYEKFIFLINPYQKVLNFYVNVVLSSVTPIFKDKKNDYILFFREWVSKMFLSNKLVVSLTFDGTDENYTKVLSGFKMNFIDSTPLVRDDNFLSDLNKIKDVSDLESINLEYKWKINDFYDYDTAKIIFQFYKNEFFIGNFDPFMVFNNSLDNNDKIDFIHKPF